MPLTVRGVTGGSQRGSMHVHCQAWSPDWLWQWVAGTALTQRFVDIG